MSPQNTPEGAGKHLETPHSNMSLLLKHAPFFFKKTFTLKVNLIEFSSTVSIMFIRTGLFGDGQRFARVTSYFQALLL